MLTDDITEEFSQQQIENDIALIGMSCKFPGADDPDTFWKNILAKNENISSFSQDDLTNAGVDSSLIHDLNYVAARGILTDVDKFDAPFFGYSPSEASITDPQHRIFLEQAWSALENAGYVAEKFPGLISLFAGMSDSTYLYHNLYKNKDVLQQHDEYQIMLATSAHFLCTKVAYALGLRGPCVNVSTACSTALVAIAMACESLNNYDCDIALAGGITIIVPQQSGYLYQESGILSPDGYCRAFDKNAKGTVISNGCGIVVLKRLADAIEAHDNIIAVIKGWAINNDGSDKVGFTAPSVNGQAACVSQAIAFAGIEPTEVDYLEAHGTGTVLGDPIEIASLIKGYQYDSHQKSQYCAIGSVKPNIGHTDIAAGVAGFIKTALALKEKILPPNINYTEANEKINFIESPFYVNCDAQPWIPKEHKRTAAVNSLGFGGTNAHVIMQEVPTIQTTLSKSANVLIISAKLPQSLEATTENLQKYIQDISQNSEANRMLADMAYTLQLGRKHFKWRRAIAYTTCTDLLQTLNNVTSLNGKISELHETQNSRVIFGFTGQGAQYANMARDIYLQQPFFKKIVDDCCMQLRNTIDLDLRDLLFPTEHSIEYANEKLRHTQYAQPALFIIEYALSQLLIELGIKPDAMIGHSIGEYVAATISGVINLQDALTLVAARGNLMAKTQQGAMLAVPLSKEKLSSLLTADIALAAHNAPELCVVSGTTKQIADFEKSLKPLLQIDSLACVNLHTSHAFHSPLMGEILEEFAQITDKLSFSKYKIPYISNVTGNWITDSDLNNKDYWTNHIRNTVRFSEGVTRLELSPNDIFIEVGPGQTLLHLVKQHQKNKDSSHLINILPRAQDYKANSYYSFLNSIGKLWLHGREIDWKNLYIDEIRKRTPLPTYCFDKQSYWINPSKLNSKLINENISDSLLYTPTWERDLKLSSIKKYPVSALNNTWLIFTNDNAKNTWCDLLVKKLSAYKQPVYTITAGNDFTNFGDNSFTIVPNNKDHYLKLLQTIKIPSERLTVIHAWLLNHEPIEDNTDRILELGAYSQLYLSQVFIEQYPEKSLQVLTLANHVASILGSETIIPAKATILGPCKVIPLEQENASFKFIDLELNNVPPTELADHIYREACNISHESHHMEIAYRGNYRWLKHLKPCINYVNANQVKRFKANGVYLITGGLGGIGLVLAEYLAKNYHANLVLTSRTAVLPENEWQEWISNSNNKSQKVFKQITALNNIKADAASLIIKQAAVEDETQMLNAIQSTREKFGHIDGVIHAAGVPGGGAAQLKTIAEYNKILLPKLQGTQILIKLLKDEPLDFMILVSSLTAITGFPGQIDYCSANLALDTYITFNPFSHPVFCVTMNWQSWRDVGMAAESKTKLIKLDERNSTSPEEAMVLFEKILNSDLNQVIISGDDPNTLIVNKPIINLTQKSNTQPNTTKLASTQDNLTETLLELWRNVLGVKEIGLDDDFYELGGHSLLAISLLTKIHNIFGIKISTSTLFKAKTVRALAEIIQLNEQKNETSPLVILQQGERDNPPLFMLHPIGGTVFCYLPIVRFLKKDRMIYGLQDPSIEQEKPLFKTLEEMATAYRKIIQEIQPTGPYYLCGASFGATLMVEITHQLLQQNERVNFAGILDGWATFSHIQRDKGYAKAIILRHQQDANSRILPKEKDNQALWGNLLQHRLNIMLRYKPKKIATQLSLFKAKEILSEYKEIEANDNHWSAYSTFPINIFHVPGDHHTMLQDPHSNILAEYIQSCLDVAK